MAGPGTEASFHRAPATFIDGRAGFALLRQQILLS
jgi:hypothetical protein